MISTDADSMRLWILIHCWQSVGDNIRPMGLPDQQSYFTLLGDQQRERPQNEIENAGTCIHWVWIIYHYVWMMLNREIMHYDDQNMESDQVRTVHKARWVAAASGDFHPNPRLKVIILHDIVSNIIFYRYQEGRIHQVKDMTRFTRDIEMNNIII